MMKRFLIILTCILLVFCLGSVSISYAANETFGSKVKNFWRRLLNYPARVAEESTNVVTNTGKKSVAVVSTEVKRVGEVTTGDVSKIKEMVTEPLTGTAETAVSTVKEMASIPVEAAKEEPTPAESAATQ